MHLCMNLMCINICIYIHIYAYIFLHARSHLYYTRMSASMYISCAYISPMHACIYINLIYIYIYIYNYLIYLCVCSAFDERFLSGSVALFVSGVSRGVFFDGLRFDAAKCSPIAAAAHTPRFSSSSSNSNSSSNSRRRRMLLEVRCCYC